MLGHGLLLAFGVCHSSTRPQPACHVQGDDTRCIRVFRRSTAVEFHAWRLCAGDRFVRIGGVSGGWRARVASGAWLNRCTARWGSPTTRRPTSCASSGREPNHLELAMYAVMWSEHCSYKSSRIAPQAPADRGEWVLVGPGENAGVVDVGDGIAAAMRIESHNHPSAIEPYQGAATGVGGILRDIFTMGARPIAVMDPLRFGPLDDARSRWIAEGVVSGVSGYGNSVGVPTVGGETVFDETYAEQPAGQRAVPRRPAHRAPGAGPGHRRRQPGRPARLHHRPRRHRRGQRAGVGRLLRRRGRRRRSARACRSATPSRRSASSRPAWPCSTPAWSSASRTSAAPA